MIMDASGIELKPGNGGKDCPGNGKHTDPYGDIIECCCDECDYLMCCMDDYNMNECMGCTEQDCLHATRNKPIE